jgi:ABC-type multidrug transport system fused ATPase/permease subunit
MVIAVALIDTVGVASIMPFLAVLADPSIISENQYLSFLYGLTEPLGVNSEISFLIFLGFLTLAITVISSCARIYTNWILNIFIEDTRCVLSTNLLKGYIGRPFIEVQARHSADYTKLILSEVDHLISNIIRPTVNMIAYSFVFIFISILLMIVDPFIALAAAGVMSVLYFIIFIQLRSKLETLGAQRNTANVQRHQLIAEVFNSYREVLLYQQKGYFGGLFGSAAKSFSNAIAVQQTIKQIPKYVVETFAFGGAVLIVIYLLLSSDQHGVGMSGEILPVVGVYAFAAYRLQPAVQAVFAGVSSWKFGYNIVVELVSELSTKKCKKITEKDRYLPLNPVQSIHLNFVSFSYPGANRKILDDISLNIQVGSRVGIVGGTGSGKSTIVDLISGLVEPTSGSVMVDSQPIDRSSIGRWRATVGYVPQQINLFDMDVAQNVALEADNRNIDWRKLRWSLELADISDFVENTLEQGYETRIGENGAKLSGGQKQRIGIARALYRTPKLLIIDEGTSSLDGDTEARVMDNLYGLQGVTLLMIAHRIATLKDVDVLHTLDKGRITWSGTFRSFVEQEGNHH